jgi:hypothetical protein
MTVHLIFQLKWPEWVALVDWAMKPSSAPQLTSPMTQFRKHFLRSGPSFAFVTTWFECF